MAAANGQRTPSTAPETPDSVAELGGPVLQMLRETRDKQGRLPGERFLTLPDRVRDKGYYEMNEMPLALDMIQEKLDRRQYVALGELEGDIKRMIANAKRYWGRSGRGHEDAEKMRKISTNQMRMINPQYLRNFVSQATPLPSELNPGLAPPQDDNTERRGSSVSRKRSASMASRTSPVEGSKADETAVESRQQTPKRRRISRAEATATAKSEIDDAQGEDSATGDAAATESKPEKGEKNDFDGLNLQQAQDKLITEMMELQDDDGSVAQPFFNLPSRDLRDYYHTIKYPTSLRGLQKLVRGIKGRDKPTNISAFKTWQAFEEQTAFIWLNAHEYNEDTSEICQLADKLRDFFESRLDVAKQVLPDPAQPRVHLRLSQKQPPAPDVPKLKLHLSSKPRAANGTESETPDAKDVGMPDTAVNGNTVSEESGQTSAAATVTDKSDANGRDAASRERTTGPAIANGLPRAVDEQQSLAAHELLALRDDRRHSPQPVKVAWNPYEGELRRPERPILIPEVLVFNDPRVGSPDTRWVARFPSEKQRTRTGRTLLVDHVDRHLFISPVVVPSTPTHQIWHRLFINGMPMAPVRGVLAPFAYETASLPAPPAVYEIWADMWEGREILVEAFAAPLEAGASDGPVSDYEASRVSVYIQ